MTKSKLGLHWHGKNTYTMPTFLLGKRLHYMYIDIIKAMTLVNFNANNLLASSKNLEDIQHEQL